MFFFFFCDVEVGFLFFFFFQAEDGIRDRNVTGVQTCALPISTASCRLRQLVGQYGRKELWVHVSLREVACFEHSRDRFNQLLGLAAAPRLLAQLLEQAVQHVREPAAGLKRLQAERDLVPAHRTSFHRGEEPLGGFRPPRPAGSTRKEPAYPPVRQCNSLRQLALPVSPSSRCA